MARGNKLFAALYGLLVIIAGYSLLGAITLSPGLDLDRWREYLILIFFGILLEWLVVSLPHGNLSVGFALVFTSFLIYGTPATMWISTVSALFSGGILNRGNPLRTTLFNGAQYALTALGAGLAYEWCGGINALRLTLDNAGPLTVYVITYFVINHLLVNLYLTPQLSRFTTSVWQAALWWDFITYVFAIPLSMLMVWLYAIIGLKGVFLLLSLILILKYLLKLYVDLDVVNRQISATYEVARSLGSSVEIEKTLHVILEETHKVVKYHTGIIYLWREEDKFLVPAAIRSPYSRHLEHISVGMGEGLVGWAAQTREPAIVYDSKKDQELRQDPGVVQFLRSLIIVPLVADNQIVGVMVVGKKEPVGFSEKHLQILTILGSQAAIATSKALLYRKLESMAVTDGLTNLFNQRYFYQKLEEEWQRAERYRKIFSLIMIDIDFFKKFNDTYGHKAGDEALANVARVVKNATRSVDTVARYGGEEFIVMLPETSGEQAMIIAERIRQNVKNCPFEFDARKPMVSVSVSVGVSSYPESAKDFNQLVVAADQALYHSKNKGKDVVTMFNGQIKGGASPQKD
ncbi:MAG TPA: sensor domain-containing diguanylate cyclase [Bacillota bacterium]|nr:sensor domain-containing diguanylate cyclase [Bacillota bacterium]